MTRQYRIDDLVDFATYPLDQPNSVAYKNAVDDARSQLRHDGCAVIKNLLRPTAVRVISHEIVERKSATHFSTS